MIDQTPPNILRFRLVEGDSEPRIGSEIDGSIVDLPAAYAAYLGEGGEPVAGVTHLPNDMRDFIRGGDAYLAAAAAAIATTGAFRANLHARDSVRLLTPVPDPGSIFMFGRIYQGHINIGHYDQPPHPNFFLKGRNCLIGPNDRVVLPDGWSPYTYGTELCIVFGRGGRGATEADALDWVYGYTICNDITARGELQHKNKMFDTFAPVGPHIIPRARIANPQKLVMKMHVNGVLTQEGSTSQALWPLQRLIKDLTEFVTVELGDIASTGDVGTEGLVKAGDVMEASIEEVGVLRNRAVAHHDDISPTDSGLEASL